MLCGENILIVRGHASLDKGSKSEDSMKIGIVGAGHIGGTLATHFTRLGHKVRIANSRGPSTLKEVEEETGAEASTIEDALRDAELVVVTIPMKRVPELPRNLFQGLSEPVVVVDTCNYYPDSRDGTILSLEGKMPESAWVAQQIGHSVVKAFNNIMAPLLASRGLPSGAKDRIALPVAGDEPRAKEMVMQLVNAIGFDPVDAGGIADSWRQQPGMPVYCTNLDREGVQEGLLRADRSRLEEMRRKNESVMKSFPAGTSPDEVVKAVRELHEREERRKAG
jgi:predicted dinucleotide-binding enzyme